MLKQDSFRYPVEARCSMAEALRLLSDFSRHAELHPLIVRVRPLPPISGALRSYAITDRLRWGPLSFPVTYRADVLTVTDDEVVSVARQRPRTTVRNHTRLRRDGDLVHVDVEITLSAPALLFPYAFRQARAAHLALAPRLRAVLAARAAA